MVDQAVPHADAEPSSDDADPGSGKDPTTRQAAVWATVVALPLAVLVGLLVFGQFAPKKPAARPSPSATAPQAQSTTPVTMAAAPLAQRPATVCRALLSQLPSSLGELGQRPVTAGPEQNAAYGDPAITLTCGVSVPSFPPEDEVWTINGVCWHPAETPDAVALTTVDREVPVRVSVPRSQQPAWHRLVPLSESVLAAVPSAASAPAGCTG